MLLDIYNRVTQLAKNGTAGYVDEDEFNGIVNAKQLTLLDLLYDKLGENNRVNDALIPFKLVDLQTSGTVTGALILPDDYYRLDSISVQAVDMSTWYDAQEIQSNQVDAIRNDSILAPNLATGDIFYYYDEGTIKMMPEESMVVKTRYYPIPPDAVILLTPSTTDGQDYLTATVDTELLWKWSEFNILSYLVLLDYGVEMKDQWVREFAQYGIDVESIKNQPV